MTKRFTVVAVLLLTLAAFSSAAQKISTDWDRTADFTKYKTYAWVAGKNPAPNDLTHKRIVESIDKQLAAKGLKKVEGEADLAVVYNAGVKEEVSIQGYSTGGFYRYGGGMTSLSKVTEYRATLVLDFVDFQKRELVWRGIASDTISDNSEKNIKKLDKAMNKLFKKYPPQA